MPAGFESANLVTQYTAQNGKHLCHKNKEIMFLLTPEKINVFIIHKNHCLKVKLQVSELLLFPSLILKLRSKPMISKSF